MTITEKYFRAIGWEFYPNGDPTDAAKGNLSYQGCWVPPESIKNENVAVHLELPNITQSFPDFKKWVLEKMEGEGYGFRVNFTEIIFRENKGFMGNRYKDTLCETFKNNEILKAAVEAATKYFEKEKTNEQR